MHIFNTDNRISSILASTTCKTHSANSDEACWIIPRISGRGHSFAVCGSRARNAGFVGEISASSTRLNKPSTTNRKK